MVSQTAFSKLQRRFSTAPRGNVFFDTRTLDSMSDLWMLHDRDMIGIKGKEGVL
jgi:hypothetical protein